MKLQDHPQELQKAFKAAGKRGFSSHYDEGNGNGERRRYVGSCGKGAHGRDGWSHGRIRGRLCRRCTGLCDRNGRRSSRRRRILRNSRYKQGQELGPAVPPHKKVSPTPQRKGDNPWNDLTGGFGRLFLDFQYLPFLRWGLFPASKNYNGIIGGNPTPPETEERT